MHNRIAIEAPQTELELLERIVERMRDLLPQDWRLRWQRECATPPVDMIFEISSPTGESATVAVEVNRSVEPRDTAALMDRFRERMAAPGPASSAGLVAARYLNRRVRERLIEGGLNYADATGHLYLSLARPAVFLRDVGAPRDPWRPPGRPRDSFRGAIASRVVRALIDFRPPMTVPTLIKRSEVSSGAAYRVIDFLERQDLLKREPRRPITRVDWRLLLERWSEDYELDLEKATIPYLVPRGIPWLLESLGSVGDLRYVLTGSAAAAHFEEYAQTRLAMVYADDPEGLARALDLRRVEAGANVLLIRPADDVVYARTDTRGGVRVASPSQVAVDLLNGPGRAPAEARALLDWMERNERAWRR